MNTDFIEYLTAISPYTMFMPKNENIIALYVRNKAYLTPLEIKFVLDLAINNLSLYVSMLNGGKDSDIDPIMTMVDTEEGSVDCIVLLKESELKGVKLVNGGGPDIRNSNYPIDYILTNYRDRVLGDRKKFDFEFHIDKIYEGNQISIMNKLEYLFESKKLKVSKEQ